MLDRDFCIALLATVRVRPLRSMRHDVVASRHLMRLVVTRIRGPTGGTPHRRGDHEWSSHTDGACKGKSQKAERWNRLVCFVMPPAQPSWSWSCMSKVHGGINELLSWNITTALLYELLGESLRKDINCINKGFATAA